MRAVGIVIGIALGACSSSATQAPATGPVGGASSQEVAGSTNGEAASAEATVGDGGATAADGVARDGGAADGVTRHGGAHPAVDDAADKRRREEEAAAAALLASTPNPKSCPATFAKATGRCSASTTCTYPEGECWCGPGSWCAGVAPPPRPNVWTCTPKVRPDGCPGASPRQGGACAKEGQRCDYTCACVEIATCTKGQWVTHDGPCKPSAPPRP